MHTQLELMVSSKNNNVAAQILFRDHDSSCTHLEGLAAMLEALCLLLCATAPFLIPAWRLDAPQLA